MSTLNHTEEDVLLALSLASGKTAIEAAQQLNISDRTVRRKMAVPEFRSLVAELRGELFDAAFGRMTDKMTLAADALTAMLDSPEPTIRLRAARDLFNIALRLRDSVEVADQIRELKDELAQKVGHVS